MSTRAIKTYTATTAIGNRRIAKFGASDGTASLATAATDAVVGVTTDIDAANGERVDVIHEGFAEIYAGAAITRGALLVADANGAAVTAAPAAGTNVRTIGFALQSAVASGDIINVYVQPGSLQG